MENKVPRILTSGARFSSRVFRPIFWIVAFGTGVVTGSLLLSGPFLSVSAHRPLNSLLTLLFGLGLIFLSWRMGRSRKESPPTASTGYLLGTRALRGGSIWLTGILAVYGFAYGASLVRSVEALDDLTNSAIPSELEASPENSAEHMNRRLDGISEAERGRRVSEEELKSRASFVEALNEGGGRLSVPQSSPQYEVESYYIQKWSVHEFQLPSSIDYFEFGQKPSGQLFWIDGSAYMLSGDGAFLQLDLDESSGESVVLLESVETNLAELSGADLGGLNKHSVKGAAVGDEHLFVSLSWAALQKSSDGNGNRPCITTAVIRAPLRDITDSGRAVFEKFFEPNSCSQEYEKNFHQAGGALGIHELESGQERLIFALGDFRARREAQNLATHLGSILSIDVQNASDIDVLAIGVRNPQGLFVDAGMVFFVDQGPQGGDELNSLALGSSQILNFGWPVESAGSHYGNEFSPDAPLLSPGTTGLFSGPLYFWNPSIAPATIVGFGSDREFAIGALGWSPAEGDMSIHFVRPSTFDDSRYEVFDFLKIGERVRSLLPFQSGLLVLTDRSQLIWLAPEGD